MMDLLKDIKYIFQIPLEWFKRVDIRVFGDHPGSGIKFEESNDGSRAIMIDFHVLDDRYSSGGGSVASVDGVLPDENRNIQLDALTEDDLGETVAKQSDLESVQATAENAEIAASNAQSTANDAALAAASKASSDHIHGNLSNGGQINAMYPSGGCLANIDSNGFLTAASYSYEGTPYVTAGNIKKLLSTCNLESSGSVTIKGDHVKLSTGSKVVETDSSGNLTTTTKSYAELTSSSPSSVGTSNYVGTATSAARADHVHAQKTYTASKWMKTDANGNVSTTNEAPLAVDSTETGFVFNNKGEISCVNGKTGTTTVNVVTGVSWNGTQIVVTNSRLTFTKGILTNVTSLSNTTINTVTY